MFRSSVFRIRRTLVLHFRLFKFWSGADIVFHRETLNIYFFPKELQLKGTVSEADCFYAGRCAGEQPYYGDWQKTSSDDRPICLVSTSTTYIQGPKFFKMCVEALRNLGWHV